jgi:hypothetical protein
MYGREGQVELPVKVTPSQPQKGARSAVHGRAATHVQSVAQPAVPLALRYKGKFISLGGERGREREIASR